MLCIPLFPLERGELAKVDAKDFWRLADFDWFCNARGYAVRYRDKKNMTYMHRDIMGLPDGQHVDHINGDKLDNRRKNLRIATPRENAWNRRRRVRSAYRFKGVYYKASRTLHWAAQIVVGGEKHKLGWFATEEEAARAYDKAARKLHGEFARLNFPKDGEQSAVA